MISDGECQEGTTWESLLIASKHKLNNLIIIIHYNKIQALSKLSDVLPLNNLKKKILELDQLLQQFEDWKKDNKGGWRDFLKSNKDGPKVKRINLILVLIIYISHFS